MQKFLKDNYAELGSALTLIVSMVGMAGSLYFSEIMQLPPCTLCWYQRILMYPLVFINILALIAKDRSVYKYNLLMAIPGTFLGLYHYIYQKTTPADSFSTFCQAGGVSCSQIDFEVLGFVTIPFLSFLAFLLIAVANTAVFAYKTRSEKKSSAQKA